MGGRVRWRWGLAAVLSAALLGLWGPGCGDGSGGDDEESETITVELSGDPVVSYEANRGRTVVVTQFIVRDRDGVPLSPSEVQVDLQVDGRAVDNESVLQESAQELAASIVYALVLDASGSMLQHQPPAFAPMKEAAQASVDEGLTLWADRPGTFSWDLCWFNDHLFRRVDSWRPQDIPSIPSPPMDAATKLYAAVEFMARELKAAHDGGQAAGPRDRHLMVVLSDGADNLSGFDDSQLTPPTTRATGTGARYLEFGWPATSLEGARAAILAHPSLTVHVLAMGSNFAPQDLENLRQLAEAGEGQFLRNPSSASTATLFERVTREFSTLQTRGASIPQQAGDHDFTVVVRRTGGSGSGSATFRYRAGPDAQVLP